MKQAEFCSFCKSSSALGDRVEKNRFTTTCLSCGAFTKLYFNDNSKSEPPDLEKVKSSLLLDKVEEIQLNAQLEIHSDFAPYDFQACRFDDEKTDIETTNTSTGTGNKINDDSYLTNHTFLRGLDKLEEVLSVINLSYSIKEKVIENLKMAHKLKKFQGRSLTSLIVSIIYATSKQCNNPINFKELVRALKMTKEEKNETMRSVTSLKEFIDSAPASSQWSNTPTLARKYCEVLKLDSKFTEACVEISQKICEKGLLEGRMPNTTAAATIFFLHCHKERFVDNEFLSSLAEVTQTYKNTIATAFSILKKLCREML